MPTYTFHHYEGEAPAGVSFRDCADDPAAMAEARRLLRWHELSGVEVCEYRREVGRVGGDDRGDFASAG